MCAYVEFWVFWIKHVSKQKKQNENKNKKQIILGILD